MTLLAGHRQRAVERAAPADLDGVAQHGRIGRLAEQAMVEFFAALGGPCQELHRPVDGDALLVAGDEERDRARRPAAVGGKMIEARCHRAGDGALHVDRAAAVERPRRDLAGKGRMGPVRLVAGRHHVGVAGEDEVRRLAADAGIEVVDRRRAGFGEGHAMSGKARVLQDPFKHAERAALRRRHRRTAQQLAGNGDGIGRPSHGPRLEHDPEKWKSDFGKDHAHSKAILGRRRQPAGAPASGSGPYRFGPTVPRRQPSSTKNQMPTTPMTARKT